MSDRSEKRPLTKMLWSVSIKTRTFASVNTCNGSFLSCLKLLKQYRTIERMCSDAHSITLTCNLNCFNLVKFLQCTVACAFKKYVLSIVHKKALLLVY